jgi:hypothetical protein
MRCYISWEDNMQHKRCRTIIASDEGISISVLELALHVFLQAAKCGIVRAGPYNLRVLHVPPTSVCSIAMFIYPSKQARIPAKAWL